MDCGNYELESFPKVQSMDFSEFMTYEFGSHVKISIELNELSDI